MTAHLLACALATAGEHTRARTMFTRAVTLSQSRLVRSCGPTHLNLSALWECSLVPTRTGGVCARVSNPVIAHMPTLLSDFGASVLSSGNATGAVPLLESALDHTLAATNGSVAVDGDCECVTRARLSVARARSGQHEAAAAALQPVSTASPGLGLLSAHLLHSFVFTQGSSRFGTVWACLPFPSCLDVCAPSAPPQAWLQAFTMRSLTRTTW